MNRLVPYLDLFGRLSDDELARLASVPADVAANLRQQVVQVDRALTRFTDLLPRLSDAELVRLTSATPKTIRFWRLCQPRFPMGAGPGESAWTVARAAESLRQTASSAVVGVPAPVAAVAAAPARAEPLAPELAARRNDRHPSGETPRIGAPAYRMPASERDSGSFRHRGSHPERTTPAAAVATFSPPPERAAASLRRGSSTELPAVTDSSPTSYRHHSSKEIPAAENEATMSADAESTLVPHTGEPHEKQRAASEQMGFDGAPFPGYDDSTPMPPGDEDGIFIGLELPDPRNLPQHGPPQDSQHGHDGGE
ncbi:MAG: hypothetical protein K0V04_37955 [Deltaproteobacteria bacterium]|nr:hypothetical protein [Deltaproteobacteria bacterium]